MTQPAPNIEPHNLLAGILVAKVKSTLTDGGPTAESVLEWLTTQPAEVVRKTLIEMQPKSWKVAAEPYVASLSDDQARATLAAFAAVFVQTL